MNRLSILLIVLFSSLNIVHAQHEAEKNVQQTEPVKQKIMGYRPHGFLDINAYHDPARGQRTLTLSSLVDLPGDFGYFSFVNFDTDLNDSDFFLIENYITEQNLFWHYKGAPVGLIAQYFSITGDDNDDWKFGTNLIISKMPVIKRLFDKINLTYSIDLFPLILDNLGGYSAQIQHVYRMQVLPSIFGDRVYIGGFLDHNMNFNDGDNQLGNIVTETQLGIRMVKQLYAVTELRWNDFLPDNSDFGVGLGLEYKVNF